MALARERLHPLTRPPTGVLQPTCCNNNEPGKPQCCSCNTPLPPPPQPATAGGGTCAWCATCVCRIRRVTIAASRARPRANRASRPPARLPWLAAGRAPGATLVCAASGASQSQRAEHLPVPLALSDPPYAGHGLRRDVRWACHLCVPHPARRDYSEPSTVPLAPRVPPAACHGRWRDVRLERHLCVPHPARRDRSGPSTSPCRSRVATPHPPTTAGGGMCTGRATCECSTQCVATTASRARHRAARAARPLPACQGLRRDVRRACHLCVPHPACRDHSEPSTSP